MSHPKSRSDLQKMKLDELRTLCNDYYETTCRDLLGKLLTRKDLEAKLSLEFIRPPRVPDIDQDRDLYVIPGRYRRRSATDKLPSIPVKRRSATDRLPPIPV